MTEKIRIDEVFCRDCFLWYHGSELHKDNDRSKFPTAIMDWLYCPKNHVVGIMADEPNKPVSQQVAESIERLRQHNIR